MKLNFLGVNSEVTSLCEGTRGLARRLRPKRQTMETLRAIAASLNMKIDRGFQRFGPHRPWEMRMRTRSTATLLLR